MSAWSITRGAMIAAAGPAGSRDEPGADGDAQLDGHGRRHHGDAVPGATTTTRGARSWTARRIGQLEDVGRGVEADDPERRRAPPATRPSASDPTAAEAAGVGDDLGARGPGRGGSAGATGGRPSRRRTRPAGGRALGRAGRGRCPRRRSRRSLRRSRRGAATLSALTPKISDQNSSWRSSIHDRAVGRYRPAPRARRCARTARPTSGSGRAGPALGGGSAPARRRSRPVWSASTSRVAGDEVGSGMQSTSRNTRASVAAASRTGVARRGERQTSAAGHSTARRLHTSIDVVGEVGAAAGRNQVDEDGAVGALQLAGERCERTAQVGVPAGGDDDDADASCRVHLLDQLGGPGGTVAVVDEPHAPVAGLATAAARRSRSRRAASTGADGEAGGVQRLGPHGLLVERSLLGDDGQTGAERRRRRRRCPTRRWRHDDVGRPQQRRRGRRCGRRCARRRDASDRAARRSRPATPGRRHGAPPGGDVEGGAAGADDAARPGGGRRRPVRAAPRCSSSSG